MANTVFSNGPSFFFGEWAMTNTSDGLYHDAYKFANKSGINLLDFPLSTAMRDVFANDSGFQEIDGTLSQENANFTWQNDQVTFVDSQDLTRLLSVNNNTNRLNEALAFQLTTRGIPVIYYGDEQYLHKRHQRRQRSVQPPADVQLLDYDPGLQADRRTLRAAADQ